MLPDGMPCPGCGYDVGGQHSRICPECGLSLDDDAVRLATSGREFWSRVRSGMRWFTLLGALAALGPWVLLSWVTGKVGALLVVGVVALVPVALALGLMMGISARMPRLARLEFIAMSRRSAAWLMTPVFSVVALTLALVATRSAEASAVIDERTAEQASAGVVFLFYATPFAGLFLGVYTFLTHKPAPRPMGWLRVLGVAAAGLALLAVSTTTGFLCVALFVITLFGK